MQKHLRNETQNSSLHCTNTVVRFPQVAEIPFMRTKYIYVFKNSTIYSYRINMKS